jgi:hypothetical protein
VSYLYSSHTGGPPPFPWEHHGRSERLDSKYGRDHNRDCTCRDCVAGYEKHQRERYQCYCPWCNSTKARLDLIARTEQSEPMTVKGNNVSSINVCDRDQCGALIKSNAMGQMGYHTGGDKGERGELQLCPACVDELVTWLESSVVGKRERSYSKPWVRSTVDAAGTLADMNSGQLMQLALERGRAELDQQ